MDNSYLVETILKRYKKARLELKSALDKGHITQDEYNYAVNEPLEDNKD